MADKFYTTTRMMIHDIMDSCFDWQIETKGLENLPKTGIIAANHQSYFDAIALLYGVYNRPVYFIVANSIGEKPLVSRFLSMQNHIILEEKVSLAGMRRLVNNVQDRLEKGYVGIFPEGRINPSPEDILAGRLYKLERGVNTLAKACKVPVIPIALSGTYQFCPKPRIIPDRGAKITVSIGKPIDHKEENLLDRVEEGITSLLKRDKELIIV